MSTEELNLELPHKAGAANNRHRSKQDYATPLEFIRACEARFGPINVDLAASADNRKAVQFIDEAENSLSDHWKWHAYTGVLWLNPPFGVIGPWAAKCRREAALGAKILFLTPASIDSNWFAENVHGHALVLGVGPRIQFIGADDPFPKPLMLSCFGFGTGFDVWRWKP